ncbi:MAG: hypothetical protein QOD32_1009 [Pyrinomonadaceae bacterium]|jgi:hypothetical protein|nr:hypothetical protein [Pyrinomonadaceae bacterium]
MRRNFRWHPGVLAAVAMTLLALLPQAHLWYTRGGDWQGAYASFDGDETAYAAYLAALIAGRPRLNDPYAGLDHTADAPLSESLFSIQFVPAYALALPARALSLDASNVFIALTPLVAFAATLALFWLLALLLADARLAACGAIIILCLGALASGGASLAPLLGLRASHAYLPFLRRYVPALPFPLLFVFCALVWRALAAQASRRAALSYAVAAGATFALLVYSYFYLWTTAAAWLACLALLRLIARRGNDDQTHDDAMHDDSTRDNATHANETRGNSSHDEAAHGNPTHAAKVFLTTAALACASLVPYAVLLARRAATMDKVQALKFTHAPDLSRVPELVVLVALAVLAYGLWRRRLDARAAPFIFAASFAITPFVVFNQQIVTGRSLQPVHYADYVLNYLALLALTLAVALSIRRRDESDGRERDDNEQTTRRRPASLSQRTAARAFLCVALAAYVWAAFELVATTRRFAPVNRARDEQARVSKRLAEMMRAGEPTETSAGKPAEASADESRGSGAGETLNARPVVLATSFMLADNLPAVAPHTAVLWSPHMHVNSGLDADAHRERLFQFLYYTGVAPENFRAYLDSNPNLAYMLFGAERVLPRLTTEHAPLTDAEFDAQARAYAAYVAAFTRAEAARPLLSYVVASPERPHDLTQLERWYERDAGVRVGLYTIYRVRLRP